MPWPVPWIHHGVGVKQSLLGGGFRYFLFPLLFSPLLGEMMQFDEHIFQMGLFSTTN